MFNKFTALCVVLLVSRKTFNYCLHILYLYSYTCQLRFEYHIPKG